MVEGAKTEYKRMVIYSILTDNPSRRYIAHSVQRIICKYIVIKLIDELEFSYEKKPYIEKYSFVVVRFCDIMDCRDRRMGLFRLFSC